MLGQITEQSKDLHHQGIYRTVRREIRQQTTYGGLGRALETEARQIGFSPTCLLFSTTLRAPYHKLSSAEYLLDLTPTDGIFILSANLLPGPNLAHSLKDDTSFVTPATWKRQEETAFVFCLPWKSGFQGYIKGST